MILLGGNGCRRKLHFDGIVHIALLAPGDQISARIREGSGNSPSEIGAAGVEPGVQQNA
jgi:hypothetical protein